MTVSMQTCVCVGIRECFVRRIMNQAIGFFSTRPCDCSACMHMGPRKLCDCMHMGPSCFNPTPKRRRGPPRTSFKSSEELHKLEDAPEGEEPWEEEPCAEEHEGEEPWEEEPCNCSVCLQAPEEHWEEDWTQREAEIRGAARQRPPRNSGSFMRALRCVHASRNSGSLIRAS